MSNHQTLFRIFWNEKFKYFPNLELAEQYFSGRELKEITSISVLFNSVVLGYIDNPWTR